MGSPITTLARMTRETAENASGRPDRWTAAADGTDAVVTTTAARGTKRAERLGSPSVIAAFIDRFAVHVTNSRASGRMVGRQLLQGVRCAH
jgi:hypothetical protein